MPAKQVNRAANRTVENSKEILSNEAYIYQWLSCIFVRVLLLCLVKVLLGLVLRANFHTNFFTRFYPFIRLGYSCSCQMDICICIISKIIIT